MLAATFLLGLGLAVWLHHAPAWVLWLYLAMSAATFVAYAMDKRAARTRGNRMPEATLHLMGLLGGWPGARLAQQVVHHKSAKASFQAMFWLSAAVNTSVLVAVLAAHDRDLASVLHRLVR